MQEASWRDRWPGGLLALTLAGLSWLILVLFMMLGIVASALTPFAPWDSIGVPVLGEVFVVWLIAHGFIPLGAALYGWGFGWLFRRWWAFAPVGALGWLGWILVTGRDDDDPTLLILSTAFIGLAAIVAGVTAHLAARRQLDEEGEAASAEGELATE